MSRFIGQPVARREDARLLSGAGRYTNDFPAAHPCHGYVVRSPHAHANIKRINHASASQLPGVLAVLTASEYAADGLRPLSHNANAPHALEPSKPSFTNGADEFVFEQAQPVLAEDRVRHVGEAVAFVVAETLEQAKDAAEAIDIEYETLPAVVSIQDALAPDAPVLWSGAPGNLSLSAKFGNAEATDRAFAAAAVVVERDFPNQRLVNCQMEPRASIASYGEADGLYTIFSGGQGVIRQRIALSAALGVPPEKVRLISADVGGGFGARTSLYPETILVAWAARRLGRTVRWNSDRTEAFLTDFQARDITIRAAAAFDSQAKLLGMRFFIDGNLGAHPASFAPLANCYRVVTTVYDVPTAHAVVRGVLTNSTPTSPYRGAGRPEATFAIERLFDLAAAKFAIDRIELRRRNLIGKKRLPYVNPMGLTYDSGDFSGNMEKALTRSDWAAFPDRRAESRKRGHLRGIGLANYVEAPVGAARERVVLIVHERGEVDIVAGTQSSGQGHETVFSQVVAERLGIPMNSIRLITGDTDVVSAGGGSHSDRSMRLVGTLLMEACDQIIAKAKMRAAKLLGAIDTKIEYSDGLFKAPASNRTIDIFAAAVHEFGELSATVDIGHRLPAHPTGCAVCELEVDPETGQVEIQRYTSIDDVGQPINPLIVDGQIHGAIAQGVGQALYEGLATDDMGQVISASFMDYALPHALNLTNFDIELAEDPTLGNPLRVKGGGEGGITPATAAIINALVDALSEHGIEHMDMPATSQRVWHALQMRTAVQA